MLQELLGLLISTSHPIHSPAAQASTTPHLHFHVSTMNTFPELQFMRALGCMHVKNKVNELVDELRCALLAEANLFQCRWLCHL